MKWRALAMTAAVMLFACAVALAQGGPRGAGAGAGGGEPNGQGDRQVARGPGGGGGMGLEQIVGQLNLTDEQKTKYDQIKADFGKKMAEAREKGGNARDAYQGYVEEVKGILNEDQLKKFNEAMAQRGGGPMGGGQGGQGRMGGMGAIAGAMLLGLDPRELQDLKLTAEQQEKVRGISQKFLEEIKTLQEKYQAQIKEALGDDQKAMIDKAAQAMKDRMRGAMGGGGPMGGGRMGPNGERPQRPDGPPPGDGNAPPPPPKDGNGPQL